MISYVGWYTADSTNRCCTTIKIDLHQKHPRELEGAALLAMESTAKTWQVNEVKTIILNVQHHCRQDFH